VVGPLRARESGHIQADVALHHVANLFLGNADQDDGLPVVDELQAGDLAVQIEGDHDMDRLARVAGRVDEAGVEEGMPDKAPFAIERGRRRLARRRAEFVGAGKDIGGLDFAQKAPEIALSR
jgi:hypothetical protein